MEAVVKRGQSFIDIAIEYAGSAEAAFDIAAKNNASVTDVLPAGTVLIITGRINRTVAAFSRNAGLSPASFRQETPSTPYIFDYTFDQTFE